MPNIASVCFCHLMISDDKVQIFFKDTLILMMNYWTTKMQQNFQLLLQL